MKRPSVMVAMFRPAAVVLGMALASGLGRISTRAKDQIPAGEGAYVPSSYFDAPPQGLSPRPDGHEFKLDPDLQAYVPCAPLKGDLFIGGGVTDTLLEQWAAIFSRYHPNVRIHIAAWGSTSAFGDMIEGITQVCLLTRDFLPFEEDFLRDVMRHPLLVIPVAGGSYNKGFFVPSQIVAVNKDNPIEKLTMAQLDAIFSKTRRRGYKQVDTWGDLGVSGEWADKPIHAFNQPMPNGVPNFFRLRVMKGGEFKETNRSSLENQGVIDRDRLAIVLGNRGTGVQDEKVFGRSMKVIGIGETEAGPFSTGGYDDVLRRAYPLWRPVHLVIAASSAKATPTSKSEGDPPLADHGKPLHALAREFVRVALSKEGQEAVYRTYFMPLSAKAAEESREMMR